MNEMNEYDKLNTLMKFYEEKNEKKFEEFFNKVDINRQNKDGDTLFHLLCKLTNCEGDTTKTTEALKAIMLIRAIMDYKLIQFVNLRIENKEGKTAYYYANKRVKDLLTKFTGTARAPRPFHIRIPYGNSENSRYEHNIPVVESSGEKTEQESATIFEHNIHITEPSTTSEQRSPRFKHNIHIAEPSEKPEQRSPRSRNNVRVAESSNEKTEQESTISEHDICVKEPTNEKPNALNLKMFENIQNANMFFEFSNQSRIGNIYF